MLYCHVGHDHVLRDVEEGYSEDGDVPCVARHMLELVLFLQGLGRRKVMGEKRERKTQFVMGRLGFAGDIPHHTSPGHEGGGGDEVWPLGGGDRESGLC